MTQPPTSPPPSGRPPDPPGPSGEGGRRTAGQPWQAFLAALLGIVVFVLANVVVFLGLLLPGSPRSGNYGLAVVGAVILLLVALAGIPLVARGTSYFVKGLGIGLMIGWALVSIVSAGFCTGLNPSYYSAPPP